MKELKIELENGIISTLYKLVFIVSLLLISVGLEKWQVY